VKKRFILGIPAIFLALAFVFGICGCGGWNKYFSELGGAYVYDRESFILKKFPSEITWEENEILLYSPETKKTKTIEYELLELALPINATSGYVINMAYATHENRLIFTEVPRMYAPHKYFTLNSPDSVVVSVDDVNAFLIDVKEASAKRLLDDANFAKTVGVSPDGRYLLYLSKSTDIFCLDIEAGTKSKIMDFADREFLGWEKGAPNFLFRESRLSATEGKKIYSDIRRYAIPQSKEDVFFSFGEGYINYEMTGDRYAYTTKKSERDTIIDIRDIYSGEALSVNVGNYSLIWDIEVCESGEYVAFLASYINPAGMAIAEVATVNTETGHILPEYEQSQGQYFIKTFGWLPDNVLMLNFVNTAEPGWDLCRLYDIRH